MPRCFIFLLLSMSWACGATTADRSGSSEGGDDEDVGLTDDPSRARAFQAPLDIFARPLDQALADLVAGATPEEAFGDVAVDDPESFSILETTGAEQLQIGELEMAIVAVKDRGPPESERWEQTTIELTAIRSGGVFRLTALHTELRRLAREPSEAPAVPEAWSELRDALLDSIAGPSCRFMPRLRAADLSGLFDEASVQRLSEGMPDQARVNRTCADWWDRTPPRRRLTIRRASVYRLDAERRVLSRYDAELGVRDGVLEFGAMRAGGE